MKQIMKYLLVAVLAFGCGHNFCLWYYNVDSLWRANEFKREYIQYIDEASMKLDSIIDSHADDGICDQLVDELNEEGYYKLIEKVDSMANTQM